MNKETQPAMAYPYMDRPMWLYSRSSDKRMFVLIQQMRNLLSEAKHREYTVVGTSQDMGTGRSMARMGLKQMMQAVQGGFVRAVLVRDLTRLSHDPAILIQILEFLQDVYKRQVLFFIMSPSYSIWGALKNHRHLSAFPKQRGWRQCVGGYRKTVKGL